MNGPTPTQQHTTYRAGDPDPTATTPGDARPRRCSAPTTPGFKCTWPIDHTHPQHVAGTGRRVGATAPVDPVGELRAALGDLPVEYGAEDWDALLGIVRTLTLPATA